jgi:Prokaryotic cytochrome b561
MTICSPTQVRNWSRVRDGRRRFDSLTIALHWATVALITGMLASAWALLASDREHAAILLNIHRSLGVVTWAVAIVRLAWRFSFAYLPPFPGTMPRVQQRTRRGMRPSPAEKIAKRFRHHPIRFWEWSFTRSMTPVLII